MTAPVLTVLVVHWRNEPELRELADAWPADPRWALLVVDNSDSAPDDPRYRRLVPGKNLGFAGGVEYGRRQTESPWVLIANPDVAPLPGALDALLEAFDRHPGAAGIVPALVGADGASQCEWQLRPLPSPLALVLQTFRFTGVHGPRHEPPDGTVIAQPAAAALAVRREVLRDVGGFDRRFFPAWFEDVDLAKRLHDRGHRFRYAPDARFEHRGGASVPRLGYGPFLWIYYRHLVRYLRRHHGPWWPWIARVTLIAGMASRLALLPIRKPRQATSRRTASRALLAVIAGAATDWARPAHLAETYRPERPW